MKQRLEKLRATRAMLESELLLSYEGTTQYDLLKLAIAATDFKIAVVTEFVRLANWIEFQTQQFRLHLRLYPKCKQCARPLPKDWYICSCGYEQIKSRCCGRCDGVNDICVADMTCETHKVTGCEICYGAREVRCK